MEALECDTQEHSFDQRIDQSEQSADQNNECDTVTVTFILSLGCVIFVSHDSTCHMTLDDLFILGLYFGSGKESEWKWNSPTFVVWCWQCWTMVDRKRTDCWETNQG